MFVISIPTSTPSPSLAIANMPTDEEVPNLAMEDPPLNDRLMITLINGAFHPSKVAAKAVTLSIRQQFGHSWPTWGAIPKDHQELFSSVLRENWFGDLRKRMKLRKFLTRKALIDFLRCLGMSEMKIKGHIGLEIMYGTICYHIGMHLGTFPSVHRQKKKKIRHLKRWMYAHRWFYQHSGSRHSLVRLDTASSVGESQFTLLDPAKEQRLHRCWVAAARPKCKGRLYSIGDLAHIYKCGDENFMRHMQGSYNPPQDVTKINQLREELRQSKEEISYALKRGTLFMNINNLNSSIRTNNNNNNNKTMTNQMTSNKMMTSIDTLPFNLSIAHLATQNYY
ncbi:hypothetical protein GmHk_19G053762 [Glycine max]|nr:hypothetical protein GmHk_19G053762 [Glycine max]